MGINEGGVQVRFSVANAEVVRQALAQLGKDGEKALRQIDSSATPVNRTLQGLSDIIDVSKGRIQGFAAQGGFLGQVIGRWGPAGLGAAAGIGAAYLALDKLNDINKEFVDKAARIREVAQVLRLTTDQVQTLGRAGSAASLDFESITNAMGNFATGMDQARRGQGTLFEEVRRVNPELALQLAATKDNAVAFDIFSRALDRAGNSQATLAKAAFGRGGNEMPRLTAEMLARGGLNAATAADTAAGKNVAEEQINKLRAMRLEIDQINSSASKLIGGVFSEHQLKAQRELAQIWKFIAEKVKEVSDTNVTGGIWDWLASKLPANARDRIGLSDYPDEASRRNQPKGFFDPSAPLPRSKPEIPETVTAEARFNIYRQEIALLGQAATPAEQLKLKRLELAAAVEKDATMTGAANRALAAYQQTQTQAVTQTRERLGIVREEELVLTRMQELQRQRAEGFIKSDAEMAEAERLMRKEVRDTMDALQLRASTFPLMKQMEQDALRMDKTLDQVGAGGMNAISSNLTEMTMRTKTFSEGWKSMGLDFVRVAADMTNRMLVQLTVGRLMQAAFSAFMPGAGGVLPGGAPLGQPGFALPNVRAANGMVFERFGLGGTFTNSIVTRPTLFSFARGGRFGEMGEAGPEAIMPLRRMAGGRLGVESSGGGVTNNTIIENHGADITESRQRNSSGGLDHRIVIRQAVSEDLANGELQAPLNAHARAPRRITRRG